MKVKLFFTKLQGLLPKKAFIALLIFTLLLPATLPQTTSAQTPPSFSTPINISSDIPNSNVPSIVVDKDGTAHAFWVHGPLIIYAFKSLGSDWSAPVPLPTASGIVGSANPSPVVDSTGTVHVIWYADDPNCCEIYYAYKSPGGTWSEPLNISNDPTGSAERARSLAVSPDDSLHAVWHDSTNGEIHYTTKPPGGSWSTPVNISNTPPGGSHANMSWRPQIAVDSTGTIHVVWWEENGLKIAYVFKHPGGSWSSPTFRTDSGSGDKSTLAVDYLDALHVLAGGTYYSTKPAGGNWSEAFSISDTGHNPSLDVDSTGRLHAAWFHLPSEEPGAIMYATKPPGGSWSVPLFVASASILSPLAPNPSLKVWNDQAHLLWNAGGVVYWTTTSLDSTPPIISPLITGILGNNNWYTSDVNVSWNVSDPESEVTSTTGCEPSSVTADTAGVTFTCEATSAGGTTSESVTIKRDATAPTVAITSPDNFAVVPTGTTFNFSATDNLSGIQSVVGSLSDGTTTINVISGYQVSQAGVYTLTVEAMDSAGNAASETRYFVVYDPAAGFATGSGLFIPGGQSSDFGDFLPNINNTSLARFGFVVKYNPGASTPEGQLKFQYQQGNFNLHSTGMEWLVVVNNNWAKFQGKATINGLSDEFPFRVDARDGDYGGGNQPDRFIIKIWAPGVNPDLADPIYKASGDLQGGNIIIHTN